MPIEALKAKIEKAKAQKKSYKKLFKKLSTLPTKQVDRLFHTNHEKAFENIDCLDCANCCKTTSPIFRDIDINRISSKLKMKPGTFIERYLILDDEGDYVLQSSPCTFLASDNKCSIYEFRPQACREYPHTNRKSMTQILNLTYKNTFMCPAVAEIVETIKKEIQ